MIGTPPAWVVVPAKDEEATIQTVVEGFLREPRVERVIVVDNRSRDRTSALAEAAGAVVVREEDPGYGRAISRGLDHAFEAGAEVAVVTEADGSFRPSDVEKLLSYIDDGDLVLGTRTTRQMVEQAANMTRTLRLGNLVVAKLLELLWFFPMEPRLTDVGCTFRALRGPAWNRLRARLREPGPAFSAEMIARAYALGMRVIEIPVSYGPRQGGQSKHTADLWGAARTALAMLKAILRVRWETWARPERASRTPLREP